MSKPVNNNTQRPITNKPATPAPAAAAVGENWQSLRLKLMMILAAAALLVYGNTLKNGFALDDGIVITENSIVKKGVSAIPEILSTPYHHGLFSTISNDLYRPLSLVLFAAEYQVFKLNASPYHFINLLLFAGCVLLLFSVIDRLFERKRTIAVFIGALLFALHPIHTEVVANIKSCDELLCFLFAFLSLNTFMNYAEKGKMAQLTGGTIFFFLSILSKETVITFLVIFPLIFSFFINENKKRSTYITVAAVAAAVIALAIRFSVLSAYHANELTSVGFLDNALAKPGLPADSRIATAVAILGMYLKLLLVPYPLKCDYSFNSIPFTTFADPMVLISLAAYGGLIFIGVRRFIKDYKDPYAFAILFFIITISLFTNIFFLIGTTAGERLMFFPSVGFCLAAGFLGVKFLIGDQPASVNLRSPKLLAVIVPVCVVYSILVFNRNNEWADSITLFKADAEKSPEDAKLQLDAGDVTLHASYVEPDSVKKKALEQESVGYLEKAAAIYPEYMEAHIDLGWVDFLLRKYDQAEANEKIAGQLSPNNKTAIGYLATIYNTEKKYPEAIQAFKRQLELDPTNEEAEYEMGDAYFSMGKYDSAEIHLRASLQKDPKNSGAVNDMAGIYFFRKDYPKAMEMYKKATELNPTYATPYNNIAVCYLYTNKYDSAIYYCTRALALDAGNNLSYQVMAATYHGMNKTDSARKYELAAQKGNPGFKL